MGGGGGLVGFTNIKKKQCNLANKACYVCHSHTRGRKFLDSHFAFLFIFSSIVPNYLDICVTADGIWILCFSALLVWVLMDYYYSFVIGKLRKFSSALMIAEEIVQKNYHVM